MYGLVQLGTDMNLLDFEVKRSKVKVMTKPNIVKITCSKHLFGEGIPVDSSHRRPCSLTCILAPVCHSFFFCILLRCVPGRYVVCRGIVYFVKHNSSKVLKRMFCQKLLGNCRLFDLWQT